MPKNVAGKRMYPKIMIAPATRAMIAQSTSWILIRLSKYMSGRLVEVVGNDKGIARGVGAWRLPDGAAPLQLQFGEVALPPSAGEQRRVQAAQREVDDERQVRIVAAKRLGDGFLIEREGGQQAQRPGHCGTSVGQRL